MPLPGMLSTAAQSSEIEELSKRIAQLELENKNMWNLQQQNRLYKEQLSVNCERLNDSVLVQDNTRLREQLKTLSEKYRALEESGGTAQGVDARPRTAEEIFKQFESYDEEVAQLLKRNTLMFEEIKTDLSATKRELSAVSDMPSTDGSEPLSRQQVCCAALTREPSKTPTAPQSKKGEKVSPKKSALKPSLAQSLGHS